MSDGGRVTAALARHPRVDLAHLPTPLEDMEALTRLLDGPRLLVKRDDCTGLAGGGNKARQLEFYLGQAVAEGADTVITTGALQSNHVRTTAAAAGKLGMACHVQLEDRVRGRGPDYAVSGNVLLDRLFGAVIHSYPEGEDEAGADAALDALAEGVKRRGGRPYVIPLGIEHPPLGALGYVIAGLELATQAEAMRLRVGAIVTPSGSATTHAGLLVGLGAAGMTAPVIGICVRRDQVAQAARVARRAGETAALIGITDLVTTADVQVTDAYLAPGYGQPNPAMAEAVHLAARREGLILDPVYSGKTMAGLIGLVRSGAFRRDEAVIFLHTGGWPAIFGYRDLFDDANERRLV